MAVGREKFAQGAFVRLFRIWAASRSCGLDENAAMSSLVERLGLPGTTAPACAGLCELVEAKLGRRLVGESCHSQRLSTDEHALVRLLLLAPEAAVATTSPGVPAAICWAANAVRSALGLEPNDAEGGVPMAAACPFDPPPRAAEMPHGF